MLRVKHQCGVSYSTPSLETQHGWMPCCPPLSSSCRSSHYRASSFTLTSTQTNGGLERGLTIQQHFNRHSQTSYFISASPGPHAKSRNVLPDNTVTSSPRRALSDLSLLPESSLCSSFFFLTFIYIYFLWNLFPGHKFLSLHFHLGCIFLLCNLLF